jgi:kynurenine formamidase
MYLFLSHKLESNTPSYGNSSKVILDSTRSIKDGDTSNEHFLSFSNHISTHIDAPYHFDDYGKSLDDYDPDFWICNTPYLIEKEFNPEEIISFEKLEVDFIKIPKETDCLLIKTGFEKFRDNIEVYSFKNPSVSPDIPIWLRNNLNLKFFGIDYISISSRANRELGRETHKAFLCSTYNGLENTSDPILLLEDMRLKELFSSPKKIIISPLIFTKSDGAPTTILAEL